MVGLGAGLGRASVAYPSDIGPTGWPRTTLRPRYAPAATLSLGWWFPRCMGPVGASVSPHQQSVFADGPGEWAQHATVLAFGLAY